MNPGTRRGSNVMGDEFKGSKKAKRLELGTKVYGVWNNKVCFLVMSQTQISTYYLFIRVFRKLHLAHAQGGVGKTTLTFHLASQYVKNDDVTIPDICPRYAKTHVTERVLVVDMCPQANISSALLGKGGFNKIVP